MTICTVNNKKYIGKYEGNETDKYLGSGKLLRRAIKRYGPDKFIRIILERYNSAEMTRLGEIYWISKLNAIHSNEFYNIAAGGEGGNTFAGIKNRKQLIEKLKRRKRPDPRPGMTVLRNLMNNIVESKPIIELKKSYYVGITCKGIYITPYGSFSSLKEASKCIGIDMTSIKNKCKNNTKHIRKAHLQGLEEGTVYYNNIKRNIGRTFKDAGFDFLPIESIIFRDEKFYEQLKII